MGLTGLCDTLVHSAPDFAAADPVWYQRELDWYILCASAGNQGIPEEATNMCVPKLTFVPGGGSAKLCEGGGTGDDSSSEIVAKRCSMAQNEDACDFVDAIVWSGYSAETEYPGDIDTTKQMRFNCKWYPDVGCTYVGVDDQDACEQVTADFSTDVDFAASRALCSEAMADDDFDCVPFRRSGSGVMPLCNNIKKGLNICEADYLQRDSNRCVANSANKDTADGYPRCTWEETLAQGYPKIEVIDNKLDIVRPCFSSTCDQVVAKDGSYASFAEYMASCIGDNAAPGVPGNNSLDIQLFAGRTKSTCLPRITDDDFAAPLQNAYCAIQDVPNCGVFNAKDSCHHASLTLFTNEAKDGTITDTYLSCEWDTGTCKTVLLNTTTQNICASAGNIQGVPDTIDDDSKYAVWCANQGSEWCIPRGNINYFNINKGLAGAVQPFCTLLEPEDYDTPDQINALCSLPTFQEEDICNAVGNSMVAWSFDGSDTRIACHWSAEGHCRAISPTDPQKNSCTRDTVDPDMKYGTYLDHVHHCDSVKVDSGVCLPAEGVYNYDLNTWLVSDDRKQCRNYTETTLQCPVFTTKDACEYVDQNVFSVTEPSSISFGRRCSWDAASGCKNSSDSCSMFDAAIAGVLNYADLVAKCTEIKPGSLSVTTASPGVSPLTRCVPELRSFDTNYMARNTCELVNPFNCDSYIAQTEKNCTRDDLLFKHKTCQWNFDAVTNIGSCSEYKTTTCESHVFSVPPTDYETYYNDCSEMAERGYVCLPFVDQDEPGAPVYRCENYQPEQVECSSFIADTMSEESCKKADGLVIPFEKSTGASDNMAFVCKWTAGTRVCEDGSSGSECTSVILSQHNGSLFDQAEACKKESTIGAEVADNQLCWPLIDDSVNNFSNYCFLGAKDGAEVTCSSGLFNTEEICLKANSWGPVPNQEGEYNGFFPKLTYCEYLTKEADGVWSDGCYYNLPSADTGCGKEIFEAVPASFEEYFDLCLGVQTKTPYVPGKECVPTLSKLDGATTADDIRCEAKLGPMSCEDFDNDEGTDAARCLEADKHLFEGVSVEDEGDYPYNYGLSCFPVTNTDKTKTVCTTFDNACTGFHYSQPDESETPNAWKDYNDKCMENTEYRMDDPSNTVAPEDADRIALLEGLYCVAQNYELQDSDPNNTCTNVTKQDLDCTLPQFQSKDACDTMKELEIRKFDSMDTFSLKCKWVPAKDETTAGECKSGMAKLLVPALMVLVSLLL